MFISNLFLVMIMVNPIMKRRIKSLQGIIAVIKDALNKAKYRTAYDTAQLLPASFDGLSRVLGANDIIQIKQSLVQPLILALSVSDQNAAYVKLEELSNKLNSLLDQEQAAPAQQANAPGADSKVLQECIDIQNKSVDISTYLNQLKTQLEAIQQWAQKEIKAVTESTYKIMNLAAEQKNTPLATYVTENLYTPLRTLNVDIVGKNRLINPLALENINKAIKASEDVKTQMTAQLSNSKVKACPKCGKMIAPGVAECTCGQRLAA